MAAAYTEINYAPLAQQPIQYTPMTVSLSQINPQTVKFKEFFEVTKKMYCSDYDFNLNNLSLMADILKTLDPQIAATYFVNEMMQGSYLFSPSDALSMIFGVIKELVGNSVWDKGFLNSLRPFFMRPLQDIVFVGKAVKLPYLKYSASALQDILVTVFVLIAKQCEYSSLVAKLIIKLLAAKNALFIKIVYGIWENLAGKGYLFEFIHRFVVMEQSHDVLLQELSMQACNCDQHMYSEIYHCFKGILRYLTAQEAYEAYGRYLWAHLQESKKDSLVKVLVIEIIGVLYQVFEKEGTKSVHLQLKNQLEEILTDKQKKSKIYVAFGIKEQTAAAKALEKIGFRGKTLEDWKKSNNTHRN